MPLALGRLSRAAEATAAYEAALSINPEFMDAHVNLAGLLLSRGRTDEAVAAFQHALGIYPIQPRARLGLTPVGEEIDLQVHRGGATRSIRTTIAPPQDAASHSRGSSRSWRSGRGRRECMRRC